MIVQKLSAQIVAGQPETVDIFSLAVRGIVNEASLQTAPALIQNLYPNLVKGMEHKAS